MILELKVNTAPIVDFIMILRRTKINVSKHDQVEYLLETTKFNMLYCNLNLYWLSKFNEAVRDLINQMKNNILETFKSKVTNVRGFISSSLLVTLGLPRPS